MARYRGWIPAVIVLLGTVLVLARPGSTAAGKPSAAIPVGYVDLEEVTERSVVGQNAKKDATKLKTELEDGLLKKQQVVLLTPEQQSELEELQKKSQTTDAQKARIAELRGAGEKLEKELQDLQQKMNPSEAEQAKIKELSGRWQTARQQLAREHENAQKKLSESVGQIMTALQDRIMKAVEEEARTRGLAMVVHKEARLFGGEDITDGVIGRLKK
jgi:Skp family chaperone for outer membrane proteins